jgi:hypothetical protein
MRASILSNTIPLPSDRLVIQEAVLDAIGERPEHERWTVRIHEPHDRPDYIIDIDGPAFKWRRAFFGPHEQTPDFINQAIKKALRGTLQATVVPLHYVALSFPIENSIPILSNVAVEAMDRLLTPANFSVWQDQIAPRSLKSLSSARLALVHRFSSAGPIGRDEEESRALLFRVFTCLRLLKPTRAEFAVVQLKFTEDGRSDVFKVEEPPQAPLNVPMSEAINMFSAADIGELAHKIGPFLRGLDTAPDSLRRAIRFLNIGYQGIHDPVIQIITWLMGIESVFNDASHEPPPRDELLRRIMTSVGPDSDVYEGSEMRDYLGPSTLTVRDVVSDLFDLRDRFVHGMWIPDEWKNRVGHGTPGGTAVPYADVLREAASYVLRRSILNAVLNPTVSTSA